MRWPGSDHAGRIVYELNGELQVLDTKSAKSTALTITVPDDGLWKRPSRVSAAGQIEDFDLSPKGERMVVAARGDIFTVPIEKGPTRDLTNSSGAHDREPAWSPDGARIAFISDKTGEEELYVIDPGGRRRSGTAHPRWLGAALRPALVARRQAHRLPRQGRQALRTVVRRPQGGDHRLHTSRPDWRLHWSAKGNYLAFSINGENNFGRVYVWSPRDGQLHAATDGLFEANSPHGTPRATICTSSATASSRRKSRAPSSTTRPTAAPASLPWRSASR